MLKVVTFNILCSGSKGEGNTIPERAPRVKKTLDALDADVIGLQEVTERWMPYLEQDYGAEYEIFNQWRKSTNHESTPILWKKDRFDCLEKGYFWLSDTPTFEYGEPWDEKFHCTRICMWVKLWDKKEEKSFTFFNTHYGFGGDYQARSSAMILSYMKALGGPCFVTADFNMCAGTPGYLKFTERLVDVNAATVNDPRATYNGFKDDPYICKPGDLCFITPETITPITSKLIAEKVDGKFASDHYAVYYELEIHQEKGEKS